MKSDENSGSSQHSPCGSLISSSSNVNISGSSSPLLMNYTGVISPFKEDSLNQDVNLQDAQIPIEYGKSYPSNSTSSKFSNTPTIQGDSELSVNMATTPENAFFLYQNRLETRVCQVCEDQAAGFHQGAYVCEACKKFFMRHAESKTGFCVPCPSNNKCVIVRKMRSRCQSCRFAKCLSVGMRAKKELPREDFSIAHIPCRVCGSKSSGFHFGAVTCEGCKGFFRRTEPLKHTLKCQADGHCDVTIKSRSICKSCRFQKCLLVGMSKQSSRIGRQPNAVKYQCALEISRHQKSRGNETTLHVEARCSPPTVLPPKADLDDFVEVALSRLSSIDKVEIPDCFRQDHLQFVEEIKRMVNYMATERKAMKANFKMQRIDTNHSYTIAEVWEPMMNHFSFHSKDVVAMANRLPGFHSVDVKSKRDLVRNAMYPVMLLTLSEDYNPSPHEDYNYFDFTTMEREIILRLFPSFLTIAEHLKESGKLLKHFTHDFLEMAAIVCILIYKNYACLLDDCRIIKRCYFFAVHTLAKRLEVGHLYNNDSVSWSDFEALLPVLENMNIEHHDVISKLKLEQPRLSFPELYIEMFQLNQDYYNSYRIEPDISDFIPNSSLPDSFPRPVS